MVNYLEVGNYYVGHLKYSPLSKSNPEYVPLQLSSTQYNIQMSQKHTHTHTHTHTPIQVKKQSFVQRTGDIKPITPGYQTAQKALIAAKKQRIII